MLLRIDKLIVELAAKLKRFGITPTIMFLPFNISVIQHVFATNRLCHN
jgi:hypothetical protein